MDLGILKQKFADEAELLLSNFDNNLINIEKNDDPDSVDECFRLIHTVKGTGSMFGFNKVVEIAHELESIFDKLRERKISATPLFIDLAFAAADHIRQLLIDEHFSDTDNIERHVLLLNGMALIKSEPQIIPVPNNTNIPAPAPPQSPHTWQIQLTPSDDLIKRCINMYYTLQDLFALGKHQILNQQTSPNEGESWNIILVTGQSYEEIENALMFVLDYCKISKIADFDIFDEHSLHNRKTDTVPGHETTVIDTKPMDYGTPPQELLENLQTIKPANNPGIDKRDSLHVMVDATKLDNLMYLVSELVTTKSELLLALKKGNVLTAMDAAEKIDKLSVQFGESTLSMRLVPLHEMTSKFNRLVRDLSKQLGKQIDFVVSGTDTELDKNIIDTIGEPIMHLIRNCIDHGIETPDKRRQKGKSPTGNLYFKAHQAGNYVHIIIGDDGKGIDCDYLMRKAVEKGYVQPGILLDEKSTYNLIFLPGFSTAESLTDISGRGMGMDIVRKRIEGIRGEITVNSSLNAGTEFTLKLQQSISITNTLLIQVTDVIYALPIENIEACILEPVRNLVDKQNNLFAYNGLLIPFVHIENNTSKTAAAIDDAQKLVVIRKHDKVFALVVDQIIGEHQTVIKPLGNDLGPTKYLAGASILGDGSIALFIDTDKLWSHAINVPSIKS
ncbi:MAG: chemotaxis protein CheA [Breznakibacter sp.]